ncbi:MAG: tail fiber protein [Erythrobacter sp.]|jgi:microcystin-dependent protein|nr:tail fiber protein [Erythrobacter sp.]
MKQLKMMRAAGLALLAGAAATASPGHAREPFLGEIMMFGGNFCPRGWAKAEGQLLAISTNQALFSLYGTMYGGDGRTTFALPDLRGRAPVGQGQGPGLTRRAIGSKIGRETEPNSEAPVAVARPENGAPATAITPGTDNRTTGTNMQPSTVVTFCVAAQGIFPPRS